MAVITSRPPGQQKTEVCTLLTFFFYTMPGWEMVGHKSKGGWADCPQRQTLVPPVSLGVRGRPSQGRACCGHGCKAVPWSWYRSFLHGQPPPMAPFHPHPCTTLHDPSLILPGHAKACNSWVTYCKAVRPRKPWRPGLEQGEVRKKSLGAAACVLLPPSDPHHLDIGGWQGRERGPGLGFLFLQDH